MLFSSENIDDIRRYYLNTYVKFAETGDTLYYLRNVDPFKLEGEMENGDIIRLYLDEEHPYDVTYVLPHKSFFQYKDKAAQLVRIPAKQYQRGISNENTVIQALAGGSFSKMPIDFTTLKAYVEKQKFWSLRAAVDHSRGLERKNSYVLNPRMAYDTSIACVMLDQTVIAEVVDEGKKLRVKHAVFADELMQLTQDEFKLLGKK